MRGRTLVGAASKSWGRGLHPGWLWPVPVLARPTMTSKSPKILRTFLDFKTHLAEENIKDVYLFIGNGARLQYKELSKVCDSLYPIVKQFKKPWLAAFGGDSCIEDRPDLGAVMKRIKEKFNMPLMAVQCWSEFDSHVDLLYLYPKVSYDEDSNLMWGGVRKDGKAVGGTAVYLSDDWTNNEAFNLTVIDVGSRGKIGTQEIAFAKTKQLTIISIEAEPRNSYDVLSL